MTSGGVCMTSKSTWSNDVPAIATTTPSSSVKTSASPAVRDASEARPSPCRRAATAVSPTLTISAREMIIQIQKSDVETAASPPAPIFVPTQKASTDENNVISNDDATDGRAMRRIVRRSESLTRSALARSPTATGAMPSCVSTGRVGA